MPCSNRGRCVDGLAGDGTCVCDAPFNGTACERCINNSGSCPGTQQQVVFVYWQLWEASE